MIIDGIEVETTEECISSDNLDHCMNQTVRSDSIDRLAFGVVQAQTEADKTVLFSAEGSSDTVSGNPYLILDTRDTEEIAQQVSSMIEIYNPYSVYVDVAGLRMALFDRLCQLGHTNIMAIDQRQSRRDDVGEYNSRAYMYRMLIEKIYGRCIQIPNIPELREELLTIRRGEFEDMWVIKPREEIREQLGRNANIADALALTQVYYIPLNRGVQPCHDTYDFY